MKNKKTKITALIIFFLILAIPLTIILTRKSQEIRKKAFGTEEISIVISPSGDSHQRGSAFTAIVSLVNTSTQKQISIAGLDINSNTSALEISQISCNSEKFPQTLFNSISANTIHLSCGRQGGQNPLTFPSQTSITLGTFQIRVKDNAPLGNTTLNIIRGVIPNSESPYSDLAKQPDPVNYVITEGSSTPTVTLTPTISPTPACTPSNGNADTNPAINLNDFELWRIKNEKANFNCQNGVNIEDFLIWKQNYLTH